MSEFVRKVVFHLHGSYQDPLRTADKPPFEVSESGYAGFMLPIDVYFDQPGDNQPQKVRFDYFLRLFPEQSCNYLQTEKVTFQMPTFVFRKKLLDGGGNGLLESDSNGLMPGRQLKQQFDHSGGKRLDYMPETLKTAVSFDEFARRFGLHLTSHPSGVSGATSRPSPPATAVAERAAKTPTSSAASSTNNNKKVISNAANTKHSVKSAAELLAAATAASALSLARAAGKLGDGVSAEGVVGAASRTADGKSGGGKVVAASSGKSKKAFLVEDFAENYPDSMSPSLGAATSSSRSSSRVNYNVDELRDRIKAHTAVPRTPMSPLSPRVSDGMWIILFHYLFDFFASNGCIKYHYSLLLRYFRTD